MKIEELLESGAHYGHTVSKWNPKFKPFIATKKNGIYIVDYIEKRPTKLDGPSREP